ncbi:MAG: ATP-binding protein [Desulfocapsaceae bacterium]|nr:ATP-binding protein [Desulfocapsaceae bacterium]
MKSTTTLDDLIGIEHCKLGFYQELQQKVEQLKKSNQQLEEKRKENQALLDGITDMMIVLSNDLVVQRVNHVFHEWYPGVDPVGRHCHEVVHSSTEKCQDCPAQLALQRNEIVKDFKIYKVNGKYRHYEIIASPLKSDPSSERQVLLFKRDVTLEKEYQAQFYQAEKMATLGTLAAGVAHEINNPLAAINGFAEGLRRRLGRIEDKIGDILAQEIAEYTDTIINECQRSRDIVQTLLTFSRPVSTRLSAVDINSCVNDTLFILKHLIKQQPNIRVESFLAKRLPLIRGDESQLKQVIINLLTNAFDAVDHDGTVTITTQRREDGGVELTIEDSGCGIPLEDQGKLFEPFFTTKPVGEGIGIGLSTCYSIVKSHEGEILVNSNIGEGSSFRVLLPEMNQ